MADLTVGYQVPLIAIVKDQYGNVIEAPSTPEWSVDDTTLASVDVDGLLVAGTVAGSVVVSATVDGITGVLDVALVPDVAAVVEVAFGDTPTPVPVP